MHGATLCYTKSFWQANPFPHIDVGEDLRFVWNDPAAKIVPLANREFMVGLIHPGNASPKRTDDDCWFTFPVVEIEALIGKDWEFYAGPPASGHGGSSHGPAAG